ASLLLTGETGTGKELFANAIHINSARASRPFVVVDCAALPEHLVESILFGHAKGAFTGADKARDGLIMQADGGTLFLDEVGELPMNLQKAFLRVLQEQRFRPVGVKKEVRSDFRPISATNRDLDRMVADGLFRKDLLYRIRTLTMELPPLRDRREDIKPLVLHHMAKRCENYGIGPKGFTPECLEILTAHDWPGNVRELVNSVESALTAARTEPTLFPWHLPMEMRIKHKSAALDKTTPPAARSGEPSASLDAIPKLRDLVDDAKRSYLRNLMDLSEGRISIMCRVSGLSRTTLYENLKKYKIQPDA
ncbi:MAG: sigma-54-dependent Fis family transcriptional regulator, partial [Desulfobacterales bacterium]|nr:sigma-54-dependent Fis family transcriptional regulator [Desulfobacterales bacterium]